MKHQHIKRSNVSYLPGASQPSPSPSTIPFNEKNAYVHGPGELYEAIIKQVGRTVC